MATFLWMAHDLGLGQNGLFFLLLPSDEQSKQGRHLTNNATMMFSHDVGSGGGSGGGSGAVDDIVAKGPQGVLKQHLSHK